MLRAEAARHLAKVLDIPVKEHRDSLHGLFPGIFPGGYEGTADLAYPDKPTTLETIIVSLVRWAGWDTVHYDPTLEKVVAPFVSPEGFPYYAPDPTPRSIPYVIVALSLGLLTQEELPRLRQPVGLQEIETYARRARGIVSREKSFAPLVLGATGVKEALAKLQSPKQFIILQSGFHEYEALQGRANPILDLSGPGLRMYNPKSSLMGGKQTYFPLGPLDTLFTVGNHVAANSYSHQSQSIHGWVENESPTVNAVGTWSTATSKRKDARVWGSFIDVRSADGEEEDAQLVGLEVDVTNYTKPGVAPNRSKVGIQVVGLGDKSVTNAIEVIGAGGGKWNNGILFTAGSIDPNGAVIGLGGPGDVSRGIDFSHSRFTDSALLLGNGSQITLHGKSGNRSALYTDDIGNGHLVLRAGVDGIRFTNNADSANLLRIEPNGDLVTPMTSLKSLVGQLRFLQVAVVVLLLLVLVQGAFLVRLLRQKRLAS